MGAVDTPDRGGGEEKKGFRKKKKRIGIRIDMTPMVDIAFLLLIFYMVTTVFAAPQAMEINLPEQSEDDVLKIRESDLLMIFVDGEDNHWFFWGQEYSDPVKFSMDSTRQLLFGANKVNPRLSTLITIHEDAKYNDFVNLLDEIEVVEYVLRDDEEFMEAYREANKDYLEEGATFSYRYSTSPWNDKSRFVRKINRAKSGSLLGGDEEE